MDESALVVASLIRHQKHIEANIGDLIAELSHRAHIHDQSKLSASELPGFVEIHCIAREHPLGAPEYEAAMRTSTCIKEHFSKNSHHPEHHESVGSMGWLDIIEMVFDWKAASDTYGLQSLREGINYQHERHQFTDAQWWLIEQIVDWISPETL